MNRIFTNMKKMAKTFSFWFVILALVGIYMHQIGQDSKSIVLISINPILRTISRNYTLCNRFNSGMQITCNTITGYISIYWYIGSVITFFIYGLFLDGIRIILKRINV